VIFDVDGTLAHTERDGHRPAFNAAFHAHGIDIVWDAEYYGELLAITGGRRRIAADLRRRGITDPERLAAMIHQTKTALFTQTVLDGTITARPGLRALVDDLCANGIRVAIATTGSGAWVHPLVQRLLGAQTVEVSVTGDDVEHLKPHPEVYLRVLEQLGVRAEDALAVEDSAVGYQAAAAANLATIVVTNSYTTGQDVTGAAALYTRYRDPQLLAADFRGIHRRWWDQRG